MKWRKKQPKISEDASKLDEVSLLKCKLGVVEAELFLLDVRGINNLEYKLELEKKHMDIKSKLIEIYKNKNY